MSSTRLPGKVLRPLAGRPMMARQLDRLKRSRRIDRLVVATSTEPIDDAIADFCTREAILCHRGPLTDVLARFAGAAEAFGPADHIVRLTADCPLTDWEIIDACINLHLETGSDYTSNGVERTFPDGLDVEVMTAAALKRNQAQAAAGPEREHVTMYIYRNPSQFRLTHLKQSFDLSALRWTVDNPADFAFAEAVYADLLTHKPDFLQADILALLHRRPDIMAINVQASAR